MTARRRTTPITWWAGRATVLVTSCALVAGLLVVLDTTTAPVPAQAATAAVLERPDEVTAQMAARAQGSKVEVSGARTESRRVWANPDGSFTSEMFPGQNWTKDAAGNWQEIDTTLVRGTDGSVTPKAAAVEVTLAGPTPDQAGAVPVVTMEVAKASLGELAAAHEDPSLEAPAADEAGTSVASLTLATQGGLPAPVLDGAQATYAGFEPGRDLRVTVLPGGVETFVDLAAAPASIPAAGVEVALPLSAKGLTVAEDGDGGLVIKDAKTGAVVGTTPQSRIWDASIDEVSGESEHGIVVDTQLRKTSTGYLVVATVPASYFATPGLTYPITVDPSATLPPSKDTYVEKGYNDTSFGGETDLKVGTYDSGTHVARSYLQFTLSDAANLYDTTDDTTVVDTAKLKLWEWHAASCTASAMNIRYLTSAFTAADSTWNTKPTQSGAIYTVSDAHRDDSSGACAEGWFDTTSGTEVKSIVQGWADGDYTNYGLALTASETASSGWKRFYSAQYATSARRPSLVLTYHHKPKPTAVAVTNRNAAGWARSSTPSLSGIPADLDGGNVTERFEVSTGSGFTSAVWTGSKAVPSGTTATLATATLTQGTQYYARAIAQQLNGAITESGPASAGVSFKLDWVPPAVTVACTGLPADAFTDPKPTANVSCSANATDATSGVSGFAMTLDGSSTGVLSVAGTGGARSFFLDQAKLTNGGHELVVTVTDAAGNSTASPYKFGIGQAYLSLPVDAQGTSSGTSQLQVTAPAGSAAHVQYSTDKATWTNIPPSQLRTLAGAAVSTPLPLTGSGGAFKTAAVAWDLTAQFTTTDTVVFVRPCIVPSGGGACTAATASNSITLDRTGIGASHTSAGPISIALTTGAASLSSTDAAVGGASVGRSYNSFTPDIVGAFGKGWTTTLDAAVGSDWTKVIDNGAAALLYGSQGGDPLGFTSLGAAPGCITAYAAPAEDTSLSLCKLNATTFRLTELDGPETTFTATSGPAYLVAEAKDPDSGEVTYFSQDATGLTRVLVPSPSTNAAACPVASTATWSQGCADLLVTYNTAGYGHTVTWRGFEQPLDGSAVLLRTIDVACYRYDSGGHLTDVWDPRDNTTSYTACGSGISAPPEGALVTSYSYDSSGRLNRVTPPGLRPWTVTYGTLSPVVGKVTTVSRTHGPGFNSGATETTEIKYGVNIGAASSSSDDTHPDLTANALATWWPADPITYPVTAPVTATAVFPPGAASTGDLREASITALDQQGRGVINAAFSGSGQTGWRVATDVLDPVTGMTVASLTPGNRAAALDPASPARVELNLTGTSTEAAQQLASTSVASYLVDDNGDGTINNLDVADVTDTYGPLHRAIVNGSPTSIRAHSHTAYGTVEPSASIPSGTAAETSARVHQVLETTQAAFDPGTGADVPGNTGTTRYAYAFTAAGSQNTTGWTYAIPTQITQAVPNGNDLVSRTVLDPATGQVRQQRQPSAANDGLVSPTDPGSWITRMWTSGAYNASTCTSTVWEGKTCEEGPAAGDLPATTRTLYDLRGRTVRTLDTTYVAARTSEVTYANAGLSSRLSSSSQTGGASGDLPVATMTASYSSTTGIPLSISVAGGTTTTSSYDDFGRRLSTDDGYQGVVTVTYDDASGRAAVVSRTQGGTTVGTTSYTYNEAGERRGLPTTANHSVVGAVLATYDADGALGTQTSPMAAGSLTGSWTRDATGAPTALDWMASGWTTPISNTYAYDAFGRVATDETNIYAVGGRKRGYTYDLVGRLGNVTDVHGATCRARTYAFDGNSNRTGASQYEPDADGNCQLTTPTHSSTSTYDAADRPIGTGVAYDGFNRTSQLPAALTSTPAQGAVSVAYYSNDLVARLTQVVEGTSRSQDWALDPNGRLACRRDRPTSTVDASACGATVSSGVTDTRNHFEGGGDSPAWTTTTSGAVTSTVWYVPATGGGLHAIVSGATVTYQLVNLHGDIPLTTTRSATGGPDGQTVETDEYGVVIDSLGQATVGPRYAWLGGEQRETVASGGLTVMGTRLYSPSVGRFLSPDSVRGGNATTFGYPTDPINWSDLSGCKASRARLKCTSYNSAKPWPYPDKKDLGVDYSSWRWYGPNDLTRELLKQVSERVRGILGRVGRAVVRIERIGLQIRMEHELWIWCDRPTGYMVSRRYTATYLKLAVELTIVDYILGTVSQTFYLPGYVGAGVPVASGSREWLSRQWI